MSDCRFGVSPVNHPDPDPEVSSVSLIMCLTNSVYLRSVEPLENMSDHLLRTDLALES